jgi:effector-binding domain-containing protein
MKVLKILLVVIGILILIVLAGFLFPRNVKMERSLTINAPAEMIYDQVTNLYNWNSWSPWHRLDPEMKTEYQNGGIGEGASYSWTSEQKSVGNGKLTISYAHAFDTIKTAMDFGPEGTATADFYLNQTDAGIETIWSFETDMGASPIARWIGVMMKVMIEKSYDEGLKNLDSVCQQLQKEDWYYVKVKTKPAVNYYSIASEASISEIDGIMKKSYTTLYSELGKKNIPIEESPFALYYTWGDSSKFECAVSVLDNSLAIKGLESKSLPETKYAVIKYTGAYEGMLSPHEFMGEWLKHSKKELVGAVMEKYKTDPETEPDSSKWVTYIMYPIK